MKGLRQRVVLILSASVVLLVVFLGTAVDAKPLRQVAPQPPQKEIPPAIISLEWQVQGETITESFGNTVAMAGDVNGDTIPDIVIGASGHNSNTGKVYLFFGSQAGLGTVPDFTITGQTQGDKYGSQAATAGDVNGDGFADLMVSATGYNTGTGRVYIYHGSSSGIHKTPNLTLTGETDQDTFGVGLASAGDINGDTYADIVIGAPANDGKAGKVYVYYGSNTGINTSPDLTFTGQYEDRLGEEVTGAGDLNHDGYADVIIASPGYNNGQGRIEVYYGSETGLSPTPALVTTGKNGEFGSSVSIAGDVNGDGFADLIVGEPGYRTGIEVPHPQGQIYIYHGGNDGLNTTPAITITGSQQDRLGNKGAGIGDVNNDGFDDILTTKYYSGTQDHENYGQIVIYPGSTNGIIPLPIFEAWGSNSHQDRYGYAVALAGDVDNDGIPDILVGAPANTGTGSEYGKVYLYQNTGTPVPAPNWAVNGSIFGGTFGAAVASAGDVNGDGFADVLIGAPLGTTSAADFLPGRAYLYYGHTTGLSYIPGWTASEGVLGQAERFADTVASAGDINGDGYADVIIGAPRNSADGPYRGRAYIYHGSTDGLDQTPTLSITGQYNWGFYGEKVATAGDTNGDGYADVLIGAANRVYLYQGTAKGLDIAPAFTGIGRNSGDTFGVAISTAGDVNADGFADVLIGASGTDTNTGSIYVYHGSNSGLGTTPAFTATGKNPQDYFGRSIAAVGDVNGDGYADIVIGASGRQTNTGNAYIYYGTASGLSGTQVLSATQPYNGLRFGSTVAAAGDRNGDGYADVLIGAGGYDSNAGRIYIYYGSANGLRPIPALTATGEAHGDWFGHAAALAGDVNGDGFSDVVIGAEGNDTSVYSGGRVYAYYGKAGLPNPTPVLTTTGTGNETSYGYIATGIGDLNGDGSTELAVGAPGTTTATIPGRVYIYQGNNPTPKTTPLVTLTGQFTGDRFGQSITGAGDVNGDGYPDVVIGAPGNSEAEVEVGKVYIYYGNGNGISTTANLLFTGAGKGHKFGYAVSAAGDVNGDGYTDVIIGAPGYYDAEKTAAGKVYIYGGSATGLKEKPLFTVEGEHSYAHLGTVVAAAGDTNGDGFGDIIMGAPGDGNLYIYYGRAEGLDYTAVTVITGSVTDAFGSALTPAGDINGDGYTDIIAGIPGDNDNTGMAAIYYGSQNGTESTPGFTATGKSSGDEFGKYVAPAGDLNGDGYTDVIITAQGHSYIYTGSAGGLSTTPALTLTGQGWQAHTGNPAGDVNGDGYADIVIGAPGNGEPGEVFVYTGNEQGGRPTYAQQLRGDTSGQPVPPWGISYHAQGFEVQLGTIPVMGRMRGKSQVEVCPAGVAFGEETCKTYTGTAWQDTATAGTALRQTIPGLISAKLYKWRARVLYVPYTVLAPGITPPPNPVHGPWRRLQAQSNEADIRTSYLDLGIEKTQEPKGEIAPGDSISYRLTYTNTGTLKATGIHITDNLPLRITDIQVESKQPLTGIQSCPACAWAVPDLLPGERGVITLTGRLITPLPVSTFTNEATISGAGDDLMPGNDSDSITTHVKNVAPVADAGDDQLDFTNAVIILDSHQSYDNNGDSLTYHWAQVGGPSVILNNPSAPAPLFITPAEPATMTFTLVVTDVYGLAATPDSVVVRTYAYQGRTPPQFTSVPPQNAVTGNLYRYPIHTIDLDGDRVEIKARTTLPEWLTLNDNGDGSALLNGTPSETQTGTYSITLQVEDTTGLSTTQAYILRVSTKPQPDLSLSWKVAQGITAIEGHPALTYTLLVRNSSSITANATLTDSLPGQTSYIANSAWASDGTTITYTNSNLYWSGKVVSGTPVILAFAAAITTTDLVTGTELYNRADLDDGQGYITHMKASSPYIPGYGLTINDGALCTNSPTVTVRYTTIGTTSNSIIAGQLSNDKAFGPWGETSTWLTMTDGVQHTEWRLDTCTDPRRPRTVYARFQDSAHAVHGPFQDAIIYDATPPTLGQVKLMTTTTHHAPSTPEFIDISIQAITSDDNSGVGELQVSNHSNFSPYTSFPVYGVSTQFPWRLQSSGEVYIRAIDRARNTSEPVYMQGPVTPNTPPVIEPIPDQYTTRNVPLTLTLTISDAETPIQDLILMGKSADTTLIPVDNMQFSGIGIHRTATITPAEGLTGSTRITITVNDGELTAFAAFSLTVSHNVAPVFTSSPITIAVIKQPYVYTINIDDPDPQDSITIAAVQKPGWLILNQTDNHSAELKGTPPYTAIGQHRVVLAAGDTVNMTVTQSYSLTVKASASGPMGYPAYLPVVFKN